MSIETTTRDRILETAWDLVSRDGATGVRMADIAKASGVSRQMVYLYFNDRPGLLTAAARWHDRKSGFLDRMVAARALAPPDSLDQYVREWWDYVPQILPVARQLYAGKLSGGPGAAAWDDRMVLMHKGLEDVVGQLDEAGLLRSGWTVDSAREWAFGQLLIPTYATMVEDCGWEHGEFAERSVRSLHDQLVSD